MLVGENLKTPQVNFGGSHQGQLEAEIFPIWAPAQSKRLIGPSIVEGPNKASTKVCFLVCTRFVN